MIPMIARSIDPFRPPGAVADSMIAPNETTIRKIPMSSIMISVVTWGKNAIKSPNTIAGNPRRTNDPPPHVSNLTLICAINCHKYYQSTPLKSYYFFCYVKKRAYYGFYRIWKTQLTRYLFF